MPVRFAPGQGQGFQGQEALFETGRNQPFGRGRQSTLLELIMEGFRQRGQDRPPNPFESLTFQSGIGSLNAQLDTQRRRDESSAAARGVQGGESGSASGANRLAALVSGTRGLAAQAGQQARSDRRFRGVEDARRRALMLQLLGIQIQQQQFQSTQDLERRRQNFALLGEVFGIPADIAEALTPG